MDVKVEIICIPSGSRISEFLATYVSDICLPSPLYSFWVSSIKFNQRGIILYCCSTQKGIRTWSPYRKVEGETCWIPITFYWRFRSSKTKKNLIILFVFLCCSWLVFGFVCRFQLEEAWSDELHSSFSKCCFLPPFVLAGIMYEVKSHFLF